MSGYPLYGAIERWDESAAISINLPSSSSARQRHLEWSGLRGLNFVRIAGQLEQTQ